MKQIKIYGERNSGTIYLEWLLKKNFEIELHEGPQLGWKHRLAPKADEIDEELKQNVIFVCLIKNPYSWLLSMHKRPYKHEELHNLSFSDFLKYSFGDYANPMVMWNLKNHSYTNLSEYVNNHIIIKYEDLLKDITQPLNTMVDSFGLGKPEFYKNIKNLLTHTHGIKSHKFHSDHYLEEKWKKSLRSHHLQAINKFIDKDLMNKFNYEILT